MKKYLFMRPALQLISQGKLFSRVFAIILRVLAILIAIAGLVGFVSGWRLASKLPAVGILGLIVFQLLFVVAIYMVVHTLFIRASEIAQLPEAEFTIIPIVSIFLRLIGEVYACFVSVIAVAGGIFIWFAGRNAWYLLKDIAPFIPFSGLGGTSFIGGIIFMVSGVLIAFFTLVFFYLLSELIVVLVDIAKNTKITRQITEQYDKTKGNP